LNGAQDEVKDCLPSRVQGKKAADRAEGQGFMNAVIKSIVYLIVAITVIFYGGAYVLPGEARVERSVEIAAPPAKVFALVGDLRRVPEWSPWVETDPATTFSFEGTEQGVGQVMRWASNNPLVGSGRETVADFVPGERLGTEIDYGEFGTATSTFTLAPSGSGTKLTRSFVTALPGVVDRWAGLMIDGSVGAEYEKGLARLRALAEAAP
jgi:uncharacterized protein YndB with AHSA1/START domain